MNSRLLRDDKFQLSLFLLSISFVMVLNMSRFEYTIVLAPLSFILLFIAPILHIFYNMNEKIGIVYSFLTPTIIGSIFVIPQYKLFGWDSYPSLLFASQIHHSSIPAIEVHTTPLAFIFPILFKYITNISLLESVKFLPLILIGITTSIYYILIRSSYGSSLALFSAITLTSIPWHMNFRTWAVKEQLGVPLVLLGVTLLFLNQRSKDHKIVPVIILVTTVLAFTHHISSGIFILIAILLGAIKLFYNWAPRSWSDIFPPERKIKYNVSIIIVTIIIAYWIFRYLLPIVAGLSPIIDIGANIGYEGKSSSVVRTYSSIYTWFRVTWGTSEFQLGLIGIPISLSLMYNMIKKNSIKYYDLVFVGLSMIVVVGMVASILTETPVSSQRLMIWLWLPSIPLFFVFLYRIRMKKLAYMVAIIFVFLNLMAFPFFEMSSQSEPDWNGGEMSYGFQKGDHTTAIWVSDYGTQQVAVSAGYEGLFEWYNSQVLPREENRVLFLEDERPEVYMYITSGSREYLRAGFHQPTTNPPKYDTNTDLDRVYSIGGGTIYH